MLFWVLVVVGVAVALLALLAWSHKQRWSTPRADAPLKFVYSANPASVTNLAQLVCGMLWKPLRFVGFPGRFVVDPLPALAPGTVRVRMVLAGVCGTDTTILSMGGGLYGLGAVFDTTLCMGHENVGVVVACGPQVDASRWLNRRVVCDPLFHCAAAARPSCGSCSTGHTNQCVSCPGLALGGRDNGTFSHHYTVHQSSLFAVPDDVSDACAVLTEPLGVALHACLRAGVHADSNARHTYLVYGAGPIGLLQVAAIKHLQPRAVVAIVARYAFQAAAARRLGADHVLSGGASEDAVATVLGNASVVRCESAVLRALGAGHVLLGGVAVAFDCMASAHTVAECVKVTQPGGAVVLLGFAGPTVVPADAMLLREVNLVSSFACAREAGHGDQHSLAMALDMMRTVDLAFLVTHVVPLRELGRAVAISEHKNAHQSHKVALKP